MGNTSLISMYFSDDSMPGQGSWPLPEPNALRPSARRPRILIVDDEKLIADTIGDILMDAGFEVAAVYDGWSAIEAAASFNPEYLLTDVSMPTMNGVELAIAIRRTHPWTKVILFSGQAGIADFISEAVRQGYEFDLIPKPIHPLKLIEIIKSK